MSIHSWETFLVTNPTGKFTIYLYEYCKLLIATHVMGQVGIVHKIKWFSKALWRDPMKFENYFWELPIKF